MTVTNVEEPGTVTLSSSQPQVGTAVTARLEDPDGSVADTLWQWQHRGGCDGRVDDDLAGRRWKGSGWNTVAARSNTAVARLRGPATVRGRGRSTTLTGLQADTLYLVRVRAHNGGAIATGTARTKAPRAGATDPVQAVSTVTIVGPDRVWFAENGTDTVATYRATDGQGARLAWRLGGPDAGAFTVREDTLYFASAPDFEAPADAGANNEYHVTVTATDTGPPPQALTRSVVVTVTDVGPPQPVVQVATPATNGHERLEVRWTMPDNTGRPALEGFRVEYCSGTIKHGCSPGSAWTGQAVTGGAAVSTTLTGLQADTLYLVRVRAHNAEENGAWSALANGRTNAAPNTAPVITGGPTTVSFAENGTDSVATYPATDAEADAITWAWAGPDGGAFTMRGDSLYFAPAPDYESPADGDPADGDRDNVYRVTVTASDGSLSSDPVEVTVTVTDVAEPPLMPTGVTVAPASTNGHTKLAVGWTAPDNTGRPALEGFRVESCQGTIKHGCSSGSAWTGQDVEDGAAVSTTLMQLQADTSYLVRVQAHNDEGDGAWSVLTGGRTNAAPNTAPVISGPTEQSVAENGTAVATYTATDAENHTISWSVEGTDADDFTINGSGQLRFSSAPDFEGPADAGGNNVYQVTVKATDTGTPPADSTRAVTVTVTDVNEPPLPPTGVTVAPASTNGHTKLAVGWTAPDNTGRPALEGFRVEYCQGTIKHGCSPEPGWTDRDVEDGAATSTTLTGLQAYTLYLVRVQAHNDEGNGAWSILASGRTAPQITGGPTTVSFAENGTGLVGTYTATDAQGHTISWSVAGTDGGDFTIGASTGQLTFQSTPNFEGPADGDRDNVYQVMVTASDGSLSASRSVTVTVTDVNEPPLMPTGVTVNPASTNGHTKLAVGWTAPNNTGRPALEGFRVERCRGTIKHGCSSGSAWSGQDVSGGSATSTTLTGLQADTSYLVRVQAHNDEGDGAWSVLTGSQTNAPPNTAPVITGGPTTVSFAENGTGLVGTYTATDAQGHTISWSIESTDAGDFTIGTRTGQLRFGSTPNYEGPVDSNRNNVYAVRVRASDGSLSTSRSVTVTVTDVNEPPLMPTGVTVNPASTNGHTKLAVGWTAPNNTGRPALEGFRVERCRGTIKHGCSSGSAWSGQDVSGGSATSTTLTGLQADTSYLVRVQAHNDEGDGAWSVLTGSQTNAPPNTAPVITGGPTTVSFAENGTGLVGTYTATDAQGHTISWSIESTDAGDFTIGTRTGQLRFGSTPNFEGPVDSNTNNVYAVRVRASDGSLSASRSVSVTVTDVNEPPLKPTGVTVEAAATNGHTKLAVGWTAPNNTGRPALEGFRVEYCSGGCKSSSAWSSQEVGGSARSTTLTGLSADTQYYVQVRAHNDEGNGAWSSIVGGYTDPRPNTAPVITGGPTTVSFAENGTGTVGTYTATDAEADAIGWSVEGTDRGDFSIGTSTGQLTFQNTPNFEGPVDSNTNNVYSVRVRASDGSLSASRSVTVTVTDVNEPPLKPTGVTVEAAATNGHTKLDVGWTAPNNTGRPALEGFRVEYCSGGCKSSSAWSSQEVGGSARSTTLTGLSADTQYYVQVRAHNDEGNGAWSSIVGGYTDPRPNTAPVITGGPTTVSFAENGTGLVGTYTATDAQGHTIGWSVSGTDGGDFSIGTSTGQLTFGSTPNFEGPADSNRNNLYLVTVRASDGSLSASRSVRVTVTDVDEPPLKPTGVTVEAAATNGHTKLDVGWTAPNNTGRPALEGFRVERCRGTIKHGCSSTWTGRAVTGGSATSTTLTGLQAYTLYLVRVRAHNDEGNGAWSTIASGRTNAAPNTAPVITGGPTTVSFAENGTGLVGTYTATDAQGHTISWSVSGTDGGDFSIGTSTGQLTFGSTPNFEGPADSNRNNLYLVTVRASDGSLSASRSVRVTVTDVDEPPLKPTGVTVDPASTDGHTKLDVSWTAPVNTGRPALEGFRVEYCSGGCKSSSAWSVQEVSGGTATSTTLTGLSPDTQYYVQVRAHNDEGNGAWSSIVGGRTDLSSGSKPVVASADSVQGFAAQAAPNPFNLRTTIQLHLPASGVVSVTIYDLTGQVVRTVAPARDLEAGWHTLVWAGRDDAGAPVASGVYLYRLTWGEQALVRKITLLK